MSASDPTFSEGTPPPTAFRRGTPSASSVMVGRLRRSSMLGRELTPDLLPDDGGDDDSLGDSDMRTFEGAARTPSPSPLLPPRSGPAGEIGTAASATGGEKTMTPLSLPKGKAAPASLITTHEHVNTGLFAPAPSSSSTNASPASAEPFWILNRHTGRMPSRKSSSHRKSGGSVSFRDRSVLRVAASLCDESSPADSEIASEAKLTRKVKSDCCASPRSMHFATMPAPSSAGPQPKNCDLHDTDYVDLGHMDFEEDLSSLSSDEDEDDDAGGGCCSHSSVVVGTSEGGGGDSRRIGSGDHADAGSRSLDGGSDGEVEMSFEGDGTTTNRRTTLSSESNGGGSECAASTTLGGESSLAVSANAAPPSNNSSSSLLLMSTSMPTPPSSLAKKGAQWTNFRAAARARSAARTSPGLERIYRPRTPGPPSTTTTNNNNNNNNNGTSAYAAPLSAPSSASSMDTSEMPQSGPHAPLLMSPSMWTFVRHGKRKLGMGDSSQQQQQLQQQQHHQQQQGGGGCYANERYEPYATSAAKRRAVSPIAYLASVSAGNSSGLMGNGAGSAVALGIPSSLASSYCGGGGGYAGAGAIGSATSSPLTGSALANGLPTPTPLSMPSPTNPLVQPFWANSSSYSVGTGGGAHIYHNHNPHHRTASGPYGRSASAFATAAAASSSSRSGSPLTRPSTPTNLSGGFVAGGAGPAVVVGGSGTPGSAPAGLPLSLREIHHHHHNMSAGLSSPSLLATQTPGSAGSGPGYGSMPAALGLSLGGNSAARTRDAEEEEGNRGGMDEGVRMLGLG
ncbi:unnamed protein product [Tilletia controversa]|nr:unnamed protein product [Tilletia caries]CAD6924848.1 unnamed protein product [Tilletia controversa]CAD6949546.1 unnamed protein product [Tilletia controversa]CAD6959286.1 unnamed protein product [Tilletia laevis]CAD6985197.1 unnamed protein product [Tilletia controversa]